MLGGRLFVIPEGYQEAQRDVIRLSADIAELTQQQGHLECEPLDMSQGGPVLPVPLHCSLVVTPAQVGLQHCCHSAVICSCIVRGLLEPKKGGGDQMHAFAKLERRRAQ